MTRTSKTLLKWTLLVLLLAYSIGMCVWAGNMAASRTCKGVEVNIKSDRRTVSEKTVVDLVNGYVRVKGMPVSKINTRNIERYLARCNNFEEVECALTSDGYLRVHVLPLIPELRVFTPRDSYYVNRSGKRVAAVPEFYVDVPVVRGNFSSKFRPTDILPLTDYIRKDSLLFNLVTMIDVKSPEDIILIPRISGHVINIGNIHNLREKFGRLMLMYKKVMPYRGWNTYDTVSVKFDRMIVCTRRDKTLPLHGTDDFEGDGIEEDNLAAVENPAVANTTEHDASSIGHLPGGQKINQHTPKRNE